MDIGGVASPVGNVISSLSLTNGGGVFWYTAANAAAPFKQRWGAYLWPVDTGSGNAGSDLTFNPWADDGSIMPAVLGMRRNGGASLRGDLYATSFTTTAFNASGPVGTNRSYFASTDGKGYRWQWGALGSGESGGNAGSDFFISRFDDNGAWIASPLTINRSSGLAAFSSGLQVTGGITSVGVVGVVGSGAPGSIGYLQVVPGGAGNSGYVNFLQPDNTQAGYVGWADNAAKTINLTALNGFAYQFTGSLMPKGPDGSKLGYARKTPKYYPAPSWVEVAMNDGVQIAQPGCNVFYLTTPTQQPGIVDGFHWTLVNLTNAPMTVISDGGAVFYWAPPAGGIVGGAAVPRTLAHGGVMEVIYVQGTYLVSNGTGIT